MFTKKVYFTKEFTKCLQKTYQIFTKKQKYKIYKNNDIVIDIVIDILVRFVREVATLLLLPKLICA